MDGSREGFALFNGFWDCRTRQPEHHGSEADQKFVECPVDFCKFTHLTAPSPKRGKRTVATGVPDTAPTGIIKCKWRRAALQFVSGSGTIPDLTNHVQLMRVIRANRNVSLRLQFFPLTAGGRSSW
jgi:hypothetical protein